MKHTKVLTTVSLILIVTLVPFTGCATGATKPPPTPVTYSFAEDGSPSAMLDFTPTSTGRFSTDHSYVGFINYNGAVRPKPEENTYWERKIAVPAGERLPLTVRASYTAATPMLDTAGATFGLLEGFGGGGNWGWGALILFPIMLAISALSLTFLAMALFIDLPMVSMNFDEIVAFDCPPLEADRSYAIRLERKKPRRLSLVDMDEDKVIFEYGF